MQLRYQRLLILAVFLPALLITGIKISAQQPQQAQAANPNVLPTAKSILSYLSALPNQASKRLIVGQFGAYGEGEDAATANTALQRIYDQSGKWAGLTGMDYHTWDKAHLHNFTEPNQYLIDKWNKGMLVTVSWHAPNPWTGKEADDAFQSNGQSYPIRDLITPGKAVQVKWLAMLDDVASGLSQLQQAGVVVIWRPLHEMNGAWFWWGQQPQADYIAVWQQMFNYFTINKGLNNLLWAYSPNHTYDQWTARTNYYYPGSNYVDIVGMDKYRDRTEDPLSLNDFGSYDDLVATGKPVALLEYGPSPADGSGWQDPAYDWTHLVRDIRTRYPKIVFFQAWEYIWQIGYGANVSSMMNDPWVVTLSDLPGWQTVTAQSPIDTIGVYRPSTNTFHLRTSNTSGPADIVVQVGNANSYPVTGDWDGDGYDTVGTYDRKLGVFYLYDSNVQGAAPSQVFVFGNPGDVPIAGHWVSSIPADNIGRRHDGVGVYDPSTGLIFLASAWPAKNGLIFSDYVIVLGNPGWKALAGHWNGGSLDTAAVYNPANARFYMTSQSCNGLLPGPNAHCLQFSNNDTYFGSPYSSPIKGDWTGQGKDGIGVFDPTRGIFMLKNTFPSGTSSVSQADRSFPFGNPGDIPVAGHWKSASGAVALQELIVVEPNAPVLSAPLKPTAVPTKSSDGVINFD